MNTQDSKKHEAIAEALQDILREINWFKSRFPEPELAQHGIDHIQGWARLRLEQNEQHKKLAEREN